MAKFEPYKFSLGKEWYTVDSAQMMDTEVLRREYSRLRNIANKRIGRLEKEYEWTKTYKEHKEGFRPLGEIDPRDLPKAFSEVAKFVRAESSRTQGQKNIEYKTTERLNRAIGAIRTNEETGEEFLDTSTAHVNHFNYQRVISILEKARKNKILYGSDKIVQLADATLELSQDSFEQVLDNLEKLIPHSHEVSDVVEKIVTIKGIDYSQVEIDDLIKMTGW